ncbi:hypothetical protein [Mycoplasma bradburyae]|uniref:Uncharacterized protein n=1 Tax=Mycoplasma bradburyae TaxID=2963128 RepID=A0AAW6HRQ8_9MOLU|nr:hypothetical protein [Mycoplasma bradburyae]MDC4163205.1 hypothetical protein [Mycoplasma bradburyae]MDC4183193.1 hypothetical protein [Mycoplasma bradburyae]MDC4184002.1 hypothetical protein [Mycoplasma bradburyae]UTS70845.1 hypothetical protein NMG77_03790 [Mycoplasma bradburyae]
MFACSFDFSAWKTWEYQRKYSAFDFIFNLICLILFSIFVSFPWLLRKPDDTPNIGLHSPVFWIGISASILFGSVIIINYIFSIINLSKINKEYIKAKRLNIENDKDLKRLFNVIQYAWWFFFIFIALNKRLKEPYLNLLIWSVLRAEIIFINQIEEKYIVKNNPKKKYLEIKAQNIRTSDILNDIREEFKKLNKTAEIDQVRVYKLSQKTQNALVIYDPNQNQENQARNSVKSLTGNVNPDYNNLRTNNSGGARNNQNNKNTQNQRYNNYSNDQYHSNDQRGYYNNQNNGSGYRPKPMVNMVEKRKMPNAY